MDSGTIFSCRSYSANSACSGRSLFPAPWPVVCNKVKYKEMWLHKVVTAGRGADGLNIKELDWNLIPSKFVRTLNFMRTLLICFPILCAGGGCKICGSVEHFRRDCPNLVQESKGDEILAFCLRMIIKLITLFCFWLLQECVLFNACNNIALPTSTVIKSKLVNKSNISFLIRNLMLQNITACESCG